MNTILFTVWDSDRVVSQDLEFDAIEDRDDDIQSEIQDYCGGNFNDAYSLGFEQGMGFLARQLQEILGEE